MRTHPALIVVTSLLVVLASTGACDSRSDSEDPGLGGGSGSSESDGGDSGNGGDNGNGGTDATTSASGTTTGGVGGAATSSTGTGDATTTSASTTTGSGGPVCGDATCDPNEDCASCASDCGACAECAGAGDATTALDAEEQAFVTLINDYRGTQGLGPLTACTSLNRAAQGHSEDMRDQDYFDHTGLDGSSPWARTCDSCYELGCGPQTAMAENIAAGGADASSTFEQWRNSPGHNANMLGAGFSVMGLGRATDGGQYGVYWTNIFGGSSEASCN